jgi:hypothetical protein
LSFLLNHIKSQWRSYGGARPAVLPSIFPKRLEPLRRQLRVPHRMLDIAVPEIVNAIESIRCADCRVPHSTDSFAEIEFN